MTLTSDHIRRGAQFVDHRGTQAPFTRFLPDVLETIIETALPVIHQTLCHIRQVRYSLSTTPCDRCAQEAPRVWDVLRTAIDLELDHPVLLAVTVSVHQCHACQHYFRLQPPFLRPDAIYTNRVVTKAVQSVVQDGMAMRRVPQRLARDFWVQPSEGSIRHWCRAASQRLDFEGDYQPWVVQEFSGVLCVDEVYQDKLALLLAVDPRAPDGDRLVGYQLVHGPVDKAEVKAFLTRLKAAGVDPAEVVTDGSLLSPTLVAQVWPEAAHQLCLFHATRPVTKAVQEVYQAVRATVPRPPAPSRAAPDASDARPARVSLGGRPRKQVPVVDAADGDALQWQQREAARQAARAEVLALHAVGVSQRAIARQTGLARDTVRLWLTQPLPPNDGVTAADVARSTRATSVPVLPPPPAPWTSWEEVRQVGDTLRECRFLFLRRPDHLSREQQAQLDALVTSPLGAELQLARSFLLEWYSVWRDSDGGRPSLAEAQRRYQAWRENPAYQSVAPLRKIQGAVDAAQFTRLSHFLRHPTWEATSNGAERMGRAFRHRQAAHFNLRSGQSIEEVLQLTACHRKERVLSPPLQRLHTCQRGRNRRAAGRGMGSP